MKNKNGKVSGGVILLIIAALVASYFLVPGVQDLFKAKPIIPIVTTKCPSSGLTEVTINAQEALASTATNANVTYYFYDGSKLVKEGDTGSDGTVSVDVECGVGKTYQLYVLNEKTQTGFYPQLVTVDASGPTDTHNFKMYEYGQINIASITSSADPTGGANISGGTGKTCGFTVTFSENESASAYNKPLIMLLVNTTAITDVTMDGVTEVTAKRPMRKSVISGHQYYVFEYDKLVKSTDGAVKLNGKVQFSSSVTIGTKAISNFSVVMVDQTAYRVAEYKTLTLTDGFVTAAENQETQAEIGAPDSNVKTSGMKGSYC